MKIKSIKGKTNRYQYNLIVLVSTLNFMNSKLKKYTQKNILYFFNGNLKRNNQKTVKIKTLQNYLYALEKKFQITLNYCRHLGKKCGSEVYYTLQYPKKECHTKINSYFKNIKEEKINKFRERVDIHRKENGSPKWECINNTNNKREKNALLKYISKCNFKTDLPLILLNLKTEKESKIKLFKEVKKYEMIIKSLSRENLESIKNELKIGKIECVRDFLERNGYLNKNVQEKDSKSEANIKKLRKILVEVETELKLQNYDQEALRKGIDKIYETYKEKPHFIVEKNKYKDLDHLIRKIKVSTQVCQKQESTNNDIKNNIFSILLEQLRHRVDIDVLIPTLKKFINAKDKLKYSKVVDNTYYYELLRMIK
ncbi:peptide transporter (plasmid) [Borrelia anserina]|uniref:Uncharacterized protein n=2 Tax=Borrelia anserina TaxID=143 RepID=W5SPX7_BORAN|nr:plasmid maintenance protein [Borrelia anserina]AHH08955.1 Hypothetical protein BAN_0003400 [Borrelia anserina BA2]APR65380.1 P57-type protein [Borrelia anserina Es]UPA07343.1 peptide transporter [Borrelia anserina]